MHLLIKGIVIFIITFCLITSVEAKVFTFTIHHFLGPKSITHSKFLIPWTKKVEKESQGKIKFEIFPSMSLGGKPSELYRQARDGVVDFIWTLPSYTPGVFPRVEVFELPDVHRGSALATNLAIQDTLELIKQDFKDVQPILIHTHAGNALHLVTKNVSNIGNLSGLKLRTPSRTGAWIIKSWGAEPVGMPVPALPQALSKKTIDGALVPFEIAITLKLSELTEYSVELANNIRFGTSIFIFVMNKKSYNSLPPDLKKIIDNNSGKSWARSMGKLWDDVEIIGKNLAINKGKTVTELSIKESARFQQKGLEISNLWVAEVLKKSIAAQEILSAAKKAVAKYSK